MAEEERVAFERRMEEDELLAEQVELHRSVQVAVTDHEEIVFEETLRGVGEEFVEMEGEEEERKANPSRRYWLVAAAVALLAVVGWALLTQLGEPKAAKELYAEHFEVYTVPNSFRGKIPKDKLEKAFEPYKAGDYAAALGEFEALDQEYPQEEQVLFYAGICELSRDNPAAGRAYLEQVLDLPDHRSEVQAKWYIALSWLAEGEASRAKPILTELASYEQKYRERAMEILDDLQD